MPMFKVTIREILEKTIYVDDVDYDFEAEDKVQRQYEEETIVLDSSDYVSHKIIVKEL